MSGNVNFTPLQFGIELEMVLRPRAACLQQLLTYWHFDNTPGAHLSDIQGGNRDWNLDCICRYLCAALRFHEMRAHVWAEDNTDYSEWTIGNDPSIRA